MVLYEGLERMQVGARERTRHECIKRMGVWLSEKAQRHCAQGIG